MLRSELCQTKVQHFGLPPPRNKNIRRLDVPVDDAFRMGRVQRIRDLERQVQQRVKL